MLLGKQPEDLKAFFILFPSLFEMNKYVTPADPHKHLMVLQFLKVLKYNSHFYMNSELKGNHNRKR